MTENNHSSNIVPATLTQDPSEKNDIVLLQELLNIEKQRIESQDKKTETARMFIELQDSSDKRQFEFHMSKLEQDGSLKLKKHDFIKAVFYYSGGAALFILLGLFGFMFFGSEEQSSLAIDALKVLFIGGAGYGLVSGLLSATKKLVDNYR